jgi:DnaJ like chaperone protein
MGLMGSLVGGMIGFSFGGPIGGILGALIGAQFSSNQSVPRMNTHQSEQTAYFVTTFSLLGKMAQADGRVDEEETRLVKELIEKNIGLDFVSKQFALQIFHKAALSPYGFEELARQFYDIFRTKPEMCRSMLDLLTKMAMADGVLSPKEDELLALTAQIFGLDRKNYHTVKAQYTQSTDHYYAVLDCERTATDEEIKKNYRRLVRDFHPDVIVSKGLPEEFTKFASEKFREIQDAYEHIKKARGIS